MRETKGGHHRNSRDKSKDSRATARTHFGRSMISASGIALLIATKFTDALTTGLGLKYVPAIYEANPLVEVSLEHMGVVDGLVVSSLVVVLGVVVVTELGAILIAIRRKDGHLAPMVRIVGYGLPSVAFALISMHNVQVLLRGIELSGLGF